VTGRIAQLSLAALRMAASARYNDPAVVAQWLYQFGTLPRLPAMDRDFGLDDDPLAVLGMTARSATRRLVETRYEATTLPGWYSFALRPVEAPIVARSKLYVSPSPEALADAFPLIAQVFLRFEVPSFKIGRGIEGLLRSDKIVAYSDAPGRLQEVAATLYRELRGCPPQGVPFTAECGCGALLSTGVDPPVAKPAVSWRSWVTNRLAASLARHSDISREEAVAAALAEIRLDGVDPEHWRPADDPIGNAGPQ